MPESDGISRIRGREAKLRFVGELAKLDRRERDVLVMHAADGLDYATIAARLGIGTGEVERLLARALVRLDRALDDVRDGGRGATQTDNDAGDDSGAGGGSGARDR